jgi:hypothetical protein
MDIEVREKEARIKIQEDGVVWRRSYRLEKENEKKKIESRDHPGPQNSTYPMQTHNNAH